MMKIRSVPRGHDGGIRIMEDRSKKKARRPRARGTGDGKNKSESKMHPASSPAFSPKPPREEERATAAAMFFL